VRESGTARRHTTQETRRDLGLYVRWDIDEHGIGVEGGVQRGELVFVDRHLGEEMLLDEVLVLTRRRSQVDEYDALRGELIGGGHRSRAMFGRGEPREIEPPDVRVTPLLALGVGVVELLEDVEGLEAPFCQPPRLAEISREFLDRPSRESIAQERSPRVSYGRLVKSFTSLPVRVT
jgi:hypothetical protein